MYGLVLLAALSSQEPVIVRESAPLAVRTIVQSRCPEALVTIVTDQRQGRLSSDLVDIKLDGRSIPLAEIEKARRALGQVEISKASVVRCEDERRGRPLGIIFSAKTPGQPATAASRFIGITLYAGMVR